MNLPDIDEMFPQSEPILFSNCSFSGCSTEIYVGDEVIDHAGYLFCDGVCEHNEFLKSGLSRKVRAGE